MSGDTLEELKPGFASLYTLERELGRGGMGVVFLARELSLDRMVAIKVLPPALAGDAATRERFLREARTAAKLSHPNIVPIFRADEIDGVAFFAMGYIDGETAAERLAARGQLQPTDVVRIVREVAWALAYAHARGVVHRDIKPENIMIERGTGRVMVTDFGIARDARTSGMTADGMVLGSVHYMAPERVAGSESDGRADLYSLGVVAYQLLCGKLPFDAPQASAVLLMQATREVPSLGDAAPGVPSALAAVIERCMAKDPAHRYPSGEELAEALDDALRQAGSGSQTAPERVLSEATAKSVWQRAAQLQADASRQVRQRSAQAEEFATGMYSAQPTSGYRRGDVEAAAVEAGIAEEFVQLALAELPDDEAKLPAKFEADSSRLQQIMLGQVPNSIRVSRVIDSSPVAVLESIGQTLPASPWGLLFEDTIGGHPLDGGILTFSVPPFTLADMLDSNPSNHLRRQLSEWKVSQLRVAVHAVDGAPDKCEMVVMIDIRGGMRRNTIVGSAFSTLLGASFATLGILVAIASGAAPVATPIFALIPFGALGAAGAGGVRLGVRWHLRKTNEVLLRMIDAVAASARGRKLFGSLPSKTSG